MIQRNHFRTMFRFVMNVLEKHWRYDMKTMLITLMAVACIGLYGAEKSQDINKQIAVLEYRVLKLEKTVIMLEKKIEQVQKQPKSPVIDPVKAQKTGNGIKKTAAQSGK